MTRPGKRRPSLPQHACGQAMTEYTIIIFLVVIVLISSAIDPSPMQALLSAMRSAYQAFSFVISYSV